MNLVVAVDRNWAIGNKGQLLVKIPEDMQYFRNLTQGHVVIYGRKTMTTFPGARPLEDRINIVLSKRGDVSDRAIAASSVEEAITIANKYKSENVYIIGGESVYEQLMPYADTAYVTFIDYSYDADAYFPNLDMLKEWEMVEESEEKTYFDLEYYFRKYKRKNV